MQSRNSKYFQCTICVNWTTIWIWTNYPIKEGYISCIVRLFVKFQIHNILNELSERLRAKTAECFRGSSHLLLGHKESFIFSLKKDYNQNSEQKNHMFAQKANLHRPWKNINLISLPWQPTTKKKNKSVSKWFQVISPTSSSAKMCMHTSISNCSPESRREIELFKSLNVKYTSTNII